ncbi:MAG: HYR domain-containing protein [Saprospiraceae bacterium]|nr:HYR domain-containing protein [Saprospiraceae bacterium]
MKKIFHLFAILFAIHSVVNGQTSCPNLVTNGDFEAGNTGFTSIYPSNCTCTLGTYCVNTNMNLKCSTLGNVADRNAGTGKFLIVQGNGNAALNAWSTTVTVTPNAPYTFSFWVRGVNPLPTVLAMMVNNVNVKQITASGASGWVQHTFSGITPSGVTSLPIAIRQISFGEVYNYGIDDISFISCSDPPCIACTGSTSNPNLIPNGSFTAGNVGFTSGLTYSNSCGAGNYGITTNFNAFCSSPWQNLTANTPPNFLVLDGPSESLSPSVLWQSPISLTTATDYCFSFNWALAFANSQQNFMVSIDIVDINGVPITTAGSALGQVNIANNLIWKNESIPWNSGIIPTGAYYIAIRQLTSGAYRDWGIDDICFTKKPPVTCNAEFTTTAIGSCGNFQFTNTSTLPTPDAPSYSWNFGDPNSRNNNTSTLQNPTHQFSSCGTYTVCMIVNGESCRDTVCHTVTYSDAVASTITCPPTVTVSCSADTIPSVTGLATATDNCGTPTLSYRNTQSGTFPCDGTLRRTWTATDKCGNISSCFQIVIVSDKTLPTITCPQNTTISCITDTTTAINGTPTVSDNCTGAINLSYTERVLGIIPTPCDKLIGRTWAAKDGCGNTATCLQTIRVLDNIPPVARCKPGIGVVLDANCQAKVTPTMVDNGSTDNCQVQSISVSPTVITGCGNTPVTLTVIDWCGNTSTCTMGIQTQESVAPVISCPATYTAYCLTDTVPSVSGLATATDNCSTVTISHSDVINGVLPCDGSIRRTWTARDACGNTSSCLQVISVTVPTPIITCPANVTLQCGSMDPSVTGTATASSVCYNPTITYTDVTSGTLPCNRVITRTWKAVGGCGRTSTCDQIVTVRDNTAPTIVCPQNYTVNTNAGQCYFTGALTPPTATDNCDQSLEFVCSLLTTSSSILISPTTQFPKGVNNITCYAKDDCENGSTNCNFTLTVVDNQPPKITCPLSVSVAGSITPPSTICKAIVNGLAPTVTDNCPMTTVGFNITPTANATPSSGTNDASGGSFSGTSTVTYTATDMAGNTVSCAFNVVVTCSSCSANAGPDVSICSGQSTTLTAVGGPNYTWSTSATTASITVSPTTTTAYYVTVTKNGCTAIDTVNVIVNPKPTFADASTTICAGSSVNLTSFIPVYSNVFNPTWTTSGSVVNNPTNVTPSVTTTYTFIGGNIFGCRDTALIRVIVNPKPNAGADIVLPCNGTIAPTTYNWAISGTWLVWTQPSGASAAITGTGAASNMTIAGDYSFILTVNGCRDTVRLTIPNCLPVISKPVCGWSVATCYGAGFNDPVGVLYDTRFNSQAPLGNDWGGNNPIAVPNIHPQQWTRGNIGQVFGIAIDAQSNIYLAASDVYRLDATQAASWSATGSGGGTAGIYKTSASNVNVTTPIVTTVPISGIPTLPGTQIPNMGGINGAGNGIGNIAYDPYYNQLFATNLEDGRIYRINLSTGTILSAFDPFSDDSGIPGFQERPNERIWGIGVYQINGVTRVYFAREESNTNTKQIWSIALISSGINAGDFAATNSFGNGIRTDGEVLEINNLPGSQKKITDLAFSQQSKRMLLAERGDPHAAKTYEYEWITPNWVYTKKFFVGTGNGENSAGGVDYGYKELNGNPTAQCDSLVWTTGNCIDVSGQSYPNTCEVYGIEGIAASGNAQYINASTDIFIDYDQNYAPEFQQKRQIGDVEIFRCGCPIAPNLFPCDSLTIRKDSTSNDCCYDVSFGVHTGGVFTVVADIITPNVTFNNASISSTSGLTLSPFAPDILVVSKGTNTPLPIGDYLHALKFCFGNVLTQNEYPQCVEFSWYEQPIADRPRLLCKDTLYFYCKPPHLGDSCLAVIRDTVYCDPDKPNEYIVNLTVDNTSTDPSFIANQLILSGLPTGYQFEFCGAPIPQSSIGLSLIPPLSTTGSPQTVCVKIIPPATITVPTQVCFDMSLNGNDSCCATSKKHCVILKPCCNPCDLNGVVTHSPVSDSCCHSLDIINNCRLQYFTGVQIVTVTNGIIFGSHSTGNAQVGNWTVTASPKEITWKPTGYYLPYGTMSGLINFCLDEIDRPSEIPQTIALNWLIPGSNGKDSVACSDTLRYNCPQTDYGCVTALRDTIKCAKDQNGKTYYNYSLTFQNTSSPQHLASDIIFTQISGPSVYLANVISVNPLPATDIATIATSIFPGSNGLNQGDKLCFVVTLRDTNYYPPPMNKEWCCHEGDTICIVIPNCDTCKCNNIELLYSISRGPLLPKNCGDTLGIPTNLPFQFLPILHCRPDSCDPNARLNMTLTRPNGSVIAVTSPLIPANFSTPGLYKLTLTGICNGDTCKCVIYFKSIGVCCTDQTVFNQNAENAVTVTVDNSLCKATLNFDKLFPCDNIASINWGDGTQTPGPFTLGSMTMHNYATSGTYIVSYLVIETNPTTGFICFEKQVRDTIRLVCSNNCNTSCKTDSVNISTGYEPNFGPQVPGHVSQMWTVTKAPIASGIMTPTPANFITHSSWAVTYPTSTWISAYQFNNSTNYVCPASTTPCSSCEPFVYERYFCTCDSGNVKFDFKFWSDNYGEVELWNNTTSTPTFIMTMASNCSVPNTTNNATTPQLVNLTKFLQAGKYSLRVKHWNTNGAPMGVNIEGTLTGSTLNKDSCCTERKGCILIRKYHDKECNGHYDWDTSNWVSTDAPLSGWTFTAVHTSGVPTATVTTNAQGEAYICNLPPGTYKIIETPQSGWTVSTPIGGVKDSVNMNNYGVQIVEFGNCKRDTCTCGTYSGMTYRPTQGAQTRSVVCGDTLIASCTSGFNWTLNGNFQCGGNTACLPTGGINWVLRGANNAIVLSGNTSGSINIQIPSSVFNTTSLYTLSLSSVCGSDTCRCNFKINATGCPLVDNCLNLACTGNFSWQQLRNDLYIKDMVVFNGKLVVAGSFTTNGFNNIAQWDGASWTALGTGLNGSVDALAVHGGKLYAGGSFTSTGSRIAVWDGTSWAALGSGTNGDVLSLVSYGTSLIVGGSFTTAGGVSANNIASWDGVSTWSSLGTGTNARVTALGIYNGNLIVGGLFTSAGTATANRIASWNGTTWSSMGTGITPYTTTTSQSVRAILQVGTDLVVAGRFADVGGMANTQSIAKWNGTNWSPMAPGLVGVGNTGFEGINDLKLHVGTLYVGGRFTQIGGLAINAVARWTGTSWLTTNATDQLVEALEAYASQGSPACQPYSAGEIFINRYACTTPVDDINFMNFRILPNPNDGNFTIELPKGADADMKFRVVDPIGRLLFESVAKVGSTVQTIQANHLASGLYFLQVVSEGKVLAVEKFVKQ